MAKNLHRQWTPMSEQLRLITECRQSGLTDADWCRENGVNPSTFYSWLARCRKSACSAQIPPAGYSHSARPEPKQNVVAIELVPDQLPESAAVPVPDQPEAHLDNVNGKAGSFYRDYGSDRGKKDVQILQDCFQAGTVFFTEDLIQRQMNDFMVLRNTGGAIRIRAALKGALRSSSVLTARLNNFLFTHGCTAFVSKLKMVHL